MSKTPTSYHILLILLTQCHESTMNSCNSPEMEKIRMLENLKKCNYHSNC